MAHRAAGARCLGQEPRGSTDLSGRQLGSHRGGGASGAGWATLATQQQRRGQGIIMTRPSRSPSSKISSVVSDVNGTLVTDQKLLTERTKAAVAALHRRGIIFSIISAKRGRNFAGSSSLLGNQATVGTGWARRSLRSEHSGKHQVGALAWQVAMDNGARRALVP